MMTVNEIQNTQEWEMIVRELTDTGFSRQYAEKLATEQMLKACA